MAIAKVGRRGHITIPRAVRSWLGLQEGDRVAFVRSENKVFLHPLNQTLLDLRGTVSVPGLQDFDAIRRQVVENHVRGVVEDEA